MHNSDDELRESFDFFDTDNNGVIDRAEFGQLLDAIGAGMSTVEADIGFNEIDTNSNGVIEFDEFRAWWRDQ